MFWIIWVKGAAVIPLLMSSVWLILRARRFAKNPVIDPVFKCERLSEFMARRASIRLHNTIAYVMIAGAAYIAYFKI